MFITGSTYAIEKVECTSLQASPLRNKRQDTYPARNLLWRMEAEGASILTLARDAAQQVLANDPDLSLPENAPILRQIRQQKKHAVNWSRIS